MRGVGEQAFAADMVLDDIARENDPESRLSSKLAHDKILG
jgi:hypothetical protein